MIANNLIITAAEYKCILTLNNSLSTILMTIESISMAGDRETETIYAVGNTKPIGEKRNAATFSGNLSLQAGEFQQILRLAGLVEGTEIENATLAVVSLNAFGMKRVYKGLNINGESIDIKNKDKQTLVSLKWNAVDVVNVAV